MRLNLIFFGLLTVLILDCSSGSGSQNPNTPSNPSGLDGTNWALYSNDAADQVLWGSVYTPEFLAAWQENGLTDALNQIGQANWSAAMAYLKAAPRFNTITSFTGYDRKLLDVFERPVNANCSIVDQSNYAAAGIPVNAFKAWLCPVGATLNCPGCPTVNSAVGNNCYFYVMTSGGTVSQTGTCSIQNQSQTAPGQQITPAGPIVDSCKIDSSFANGFSCQNWVKTTTPMESINLQVKNLYDSGKPLGCMSPATIVNAPTVWGGLGIGNQITYEDPSIVVPVEVPTYLDATLLYANPYSNDDISGQTSPVPNVAGNTNYSILNAWGNFCGDNRGFCFAANGGASTGGLAHIIGAMGPLSRSKYVANLKAVNPKGYYTWQYDDAAGQTVCNSAKSKSIAIFCPGSAVLSNAQLSTIFGTSDSRFGAYNNCSYPIWVQAKPVPAAAPVPAYCVPPPTGVPNMTVNADDCLISLAPGSSHRYKTQAKGLQSFNIWSKTGCDPTGFNCATGETGDNGGYTGRSYGPQPDIETAVEGTFGCTLANTAGCEQTGNGSTLGPTTYLDVTFVNGFTRPVWLQVVPGTDETNPACVTAAAPKIDMSICPTDEDLSTRP
ncbi:MAG: hypothetical protein V4534_03530 [Myxococcota bacterium]